MSFPKLLKIINVSTVTKLPVIKIKLKILKLLEKMLKKKKKVVAKFFFLKKKSFL
jgi:hypothetical protein